MQYKITNGLKVSDIILGTDYYGSLVIKKEAFRLLDIFKSRGGTCIDTAKLYVDGISEEIIGDWLKTAGRDKMIISTKGGHPNLESMNISRLSKDEIEKDLNSSLSRLKTDYTDIYFLHRDDEKIPVEEIIETLNLFVRQGKIRSLGASNWRAERILKANEYAKKAGLSGFDFSQIKYSLAVTNPQYKDDPTLVEMNDAEYKIYSREKLSLFAFASQGKGFFSKLENGEDALGKKAKERYLCSKNKKRFEALKELKHKYKTTASAIVLSYIYSDKNLKASAIIGPKCKTQLYDCLNASHINLSAEETEYLKSI